MRGVLHQRVLEGVDRIGRRAALEDQLGGDEAGERGLQLVLGKAGDRTQQRDRRTRVRSRRRSAPPAAPRPGGRAAPSASRAGSSGSRTAAERGRARSDPPPRARSRSPGRSWSAPRRTAARHRCDRRSGRRPRRAMPCRRRSARPGRSGRAGPRRLSASIVTCGWPVQGGWNSGRNVTISNTGRLRTRSTVRSSSSREVGSIQCASSKTITTGCWRARPSSCRISAASVRSFLRCGLRFGSGWRSEAGNDSRSARNATSSSGSAARASKASSFSSLPPGVSSRANPAARPSWSINGNSALSW